MNLKTYAVFALSCVAVAGTQLAGCGSENLFESAVKKTDKDRGEKDLANGNYDAAIANLTDYIKNHPEDAEARSMLASALLKKSGLNELEVSGKISKSGSDWKSITDALPAGTAENQARLELAVSSLEAISADKRTAEQSYQLALAQTSLAVTVIKKVAGDDTGKITDEKVDAMSDDDANKILSSLNGSRDTIGSSGLGASNPGASKIGTVSDKIAATEGTTDTEKLRAYLKKNK